MGDNDVWIIFIIIITVKWIFKFQTTNSVSHLGNRVRFFCMYVFWFNKNNNNNKINIDLRHIVVLYTYIVNIIYIYVHTHYTYTYVRREIQTMNHTISHFFIHFVYLYILYTQLQLVFSYYYYFCWFIIHVLTCTIYVCIVIVWQPKIFWTKKNFFYDVCCFQNKEDEKYTEASKVVKF